MLPKISVIIPVYNVADYLRECIDSVISQTYTNIEIILIDDGSTDDSGKICDEYEQKDNRIKVMHKPNGGVSSARNAGLGAADGELITFIDSDDWIDTDTIELLQKNLTEHSADISCCNISLVYKDKKVPKNFEESGILTLNSEQAISSMLQNTYVAAGAVPKLFRKQAIIGIKFPEEYKCGEDMLFMFEALLNSKIIICDTKPKYYARQRKSSAVHTIDSKRITDEIKAGEHILEILQKRKSDITGIAKDRQLTVRLRILGTLINDKSYKQNPECMKILSELRRDFMLYLKGKEYRKKNKAALCILRINVYLYRCFAGIYTKTSDEKLY